jgi:hypothetical protein
MNDTNIGFPEAARQLGVPLRVLRHAIRTGKIAAPAQNNATASLSAEWLAEARKAAATPQTLSRALKGPKAPPFAHYEGTSCWRKYKVRVRDYNHYHAAQKATA